jgi:hypothetical protein
MSLEDSQMHRLSKQYGQQSRKCNINMFGLWAGGNVNWSLPGKRSETMKLPSGIQLSDWRLFS